MARQEESDRKAYPVDLIELHRWEKGLIAHASDKLMHFFVDNLGVEEPWDWLNARTRVLKSIIIEGGSPVKLDGRGYELVFRWPSPTRMDARKLTTWHDEEPAFRFVDRSAGRFLPSGRSYLFRTVDEIAEEMSDVYKLEVNRKTGSFRFPKDYYAHSLGISRAPVLELN